MLFGRFLLGLIFVGLVFSLSIRSKSRPHTLIKKTSEPGPGFFCGLCQDSVVPLFHALENNSTTFFHDLEKVCDLFPGDIKKKCVNGVESLPIAVSGGEVSLLQKYSVRQVCSILSLCEVDCCLVADIPEQIHISLTGNNGEMRVTWTTRNETIGKPVIYIDVIPPERDGGKFNVSSGTFRAVTTNYTYSFATNGWRGFLHSVVVNGLVGGQRYYYQVGDTNDYSEGSENGYWSQPLLYFVAPVLNAKKVSGMLVGDMGGSDVSDNTVYQMTMHRMQGDTDVILHIGDISYADMNEYLDDDFMRKVEPFAAYIPYMTIPGNHEAFFEFSAYKNRWPMPLANPNDLYYSFNYGPVHFVMMNTEMNNDMPGMFPPGSPQYNWLLADLETAAANRATQPWIVVLSHRPFYCMRITRDCTDIAARFRSWVEPLFLKYKVDLAVGAHRHIYERTYPLANGAPTSFNYTRPSSPVYVVNGAAGNQEHNDGPYDKPENWLALQSSAYGYSTFYADMSSFNFKFYGADQNVLIDDFTITK
eukprot:comp19905_c0_seq1/m.38702 comp19905_c0_seq1/g.38702  ORF comp19905_c0_seq1/g.38702 comp19905_c0_seq1/m.38702 type:complete len:532 (-) comp19905_c0_seq1:52-1647(-)